ncbi:MAG: hypothetical protein N839_0015045 [Desulfofustis sp. PB-SRB1]|nr:hypothetical protein [Desulfofustis sp. PB-SRB1]MBM1003712.1 hypothetical protein [Desulfofustis sp. PB-SRB1]HBH29834.1 hypothetical protein [Desulfofustis sp.]
MENKRRAKNINNVSRHKKVLVLLCILSIVFLTLPLTIQAEAQETDSDWQFAAELYLWYASIGGSTAVGGDLEIDANDLIDGLNMAFMGNIAARKNRWGIMVDALYLNASDSQNTMVGPTGVNVGVELDGWVVNPMAGYLVVNSDIFFMNLVAGTRYLSLSTDVNLRNADPGGAPFNMGVSESGSNWDAMIGVRGELSLNSEWFVPYHLDIGAGDSDFTWQAFAGLGYRFKSFDVLIGYRYLYWDFDDNAALGDLDLSGVGAGIRFYF